MAGKACPNWNSLTPDQKNVFARQAEVYAAYLRPTPITKSAG